ncbi:hypothetical protein MSEO_10450 [Mycobacterium seoulense]|uniref:Uncharacterized protein n=1 Tax=Mycobacterium seoulense TaxID=386911 RepID=A0A7I7NV23_9MYCO|nr:hypothetical protein MSEO_10450 [Mycobacterium seoulense]
MWLDKPRRQHVLAGPAGYQSGEPRTHRPAVAFMHPWTQRAADRLTGDARACTWATILKRYYASRAPRATAFRVRPIAA